MESVSRSPSIVLHEALASPRPSSRQASARSRGIQTLFDAIRSKSETKLQDALEGFRHEGVFVGRCKLWLWVRWEEGVCWEGCGCLSGCCAGCEPVAGKVLRGGGGGRARGWRARILVGRPRQAAPGERQDSHSPCTCKPAC